MTQLLVPARGEKSEKQLNNKNNHFGFGQWRLMAFALLSSLILASCTKKDSGMTDGDLNLNISGLEDLGTDYVYEGWIMVDGSPMTTGRFTVNSTGALSQTAFPINKEDLDKATAFILTIEPAVGDDPAPSDVHILAGDFSGNTGTMTIADPRAIGNNFSTAAGKYLLATPTDADTTNEQNGVWFLDNSSGSAAPGLTLPTLPSGWVYEGWAVVNGTPVSTGTFTQASGADNFSGYSGSMASPPFPGEDLLMNAPSGLTFPTDIRGGAVVISVEPVPDNSTAPFLIKPLLHHTPAAAAVHSVLMMDQNLASIPSGTFMR